MANNNSVDTIMEDKDFKGKGKEEDKGQDYYFQYYASLQNQANMIGDIARTSAYRRAIIGNSKVAFQDKLVIDIGAGSGVLSFFAAQAGALNIKAIEASNMSSKLSLLLKHASPTHNPHLLNTIQVLSGKIEDPQIQALALTLGKVDTIISEPIGVMLFHERMIESFLLARDLFLKPPIANEQGGSGGGGALYPGKAGLWFAPFSDEGLFVETEGKASFFDGVLFGTDFRSLVEEAREEVFAQPVVGLIPPSTLMGEATCPREFNFYTLSLTEVVDFTLPLDWVASRTGILHGVASWFDLQFSPPPSTTPINEPFNEALHIQWDAAVAAETNSAGGWTSAWPGQELNPPILPESPLDGVEVKLDTGPFSTRTHWQQARLLLPQPLAVNKGERLLGTIHFKANESRSYDLTVNIGIDRGDDYIDDPRIRRTGKYNLAQQCFNYSYTGEETMGMGGLNGMTAAAAAAAAVAAAQAQVAAGFGSSVAGGVGANGGKGY